MVFVTEMWEQFKEYVAGASRIVGTYQTLAVMEGIEMRILAGRLGFRRKFASMETRSDEEKALLDQILRFCRIHDFIEVVGSVPDEQFHS